MAESSSIEWTDATWNIVTGCSIKSPGCAGCYAMRLAGTRLRNHPSRAGLTTMTKAGPVWNGQVRFNAEWLDQPLRWARPRMIFVCAHGDLFHEDVPDEWLHAVFGTMRQARHHTFQVLTKRADVMLRFCRDQAPMPHVWLGFSAERQQELDERAPYVEPLSHAGWRTWCSAEPLLGPMELTGAAWLQWVVVGGESGPGARPMHPEWARRLRHECGVYGIPFHFKQWGAWKHGSDFAPNAKAVLLDGRVVEPTQEAMLAADRQERVLGATMMRFVGKKAAGRLLDGRTHDGMPTAVQLGLPL